MAFLEEMHMVTVLKCRRMQDAIIDNVCEYVQGFTISYDEQLKALSAATQAAPATSGAEMVGNDEDSQQSLADRVVSSIKTCHSHADVDAERCETPLPSISREILKDVEALQDVAARVNSVCREEMGLAVRSVTPNMAESSTCKELLAEVGTSAVQQNCKAEDSTCRELPTEVGTSDVQQNCKEAPSEVRASVVQQNYKEAPSEVRASCKQKDATDKVVRDGPSDHQRQDGLADMLTQIMLLEQNLRNVSVRPPAAVTAKT
jgi:hypothetical protein